MSVGFSCWTFCDCAVGNGFYLTENLKRFCTAIPITIISSVLLFHNYETHSPVFCDGLS